MYSSKWIEEWANQWEADQEFKRKAKQVKRQAKFERKKARQADFGFVPPTPTLAYTDWPAVTIRSVKRDYDPVLYGRPAGSRWPETAEEAQKG